MAKKDIKIKCKYYIHAVVIQHDDILNHDFVYRFEVNCDSVQEFVVTSSDVYPHSCIRFLGEVYQSDMDYRPWYRTD